MSKTEIDALTTEFFGAFDNRGGRRPDVELLRRILLPAALVVVTRPRFVVHSVEEFIAPREALLTDGRLVEFSEWETSERTEVVGDIASRLSTYRKDGVMNGEPYRGGGTKTIQFVRTPDGWRISSIAWYDDEA